MKKYLRHSMISIISVISYIYLNNVNISPLTMCSLFIKMICCNRSMTDKDIVYDPADISVPQSGALSNSAFGCVPFEDVKKVASSVENIIEHVLAPQTKTVKDIAHLFESK